MARPRPDAVDSLPMLARAILRELRAARCIIERIEYLLAEGAADGGRLYNVAHAMRHTKSASGQGMHVRARPGIDSAALAFRRARGRGGPLFASSSTGGPGQRHF